MDSFRRITAHYGDKHYYLYLSNAQCTKYNNYAMTSCGLQIPDDVPISVLNWLLCHKRAIQIDATTANHSGCQSSCILRGDKICRW